MPTVFDSMLESLTTSETKYMQDEDHAGDEMLN